MRGHQSAVTKKKNNDKREKVKKGHTANEEAERKSEGAEREREGEKLRLYRLGVRLN